MDSKHWHRWFGSLAVAIALAALTGRAGAQAEEAPGVVPVAGEAKTQAAEVPAGDAAGAPSLGQVASWISELDSDRYRVREVATQNLIDVVKGGDAAALEPLLAAANGGRPEQEDRAVWVLRQSMDAENLELRQQVLEHLVQVQDRPHVVAEARLALAQIQHDFAVRELEKLGGQFHDIGEDAFFQQRLPRRVVLTNEWRGGDDGLKLCREMTDIGMVIVLGTNVTVDGLAQLAKVPTLQYIRLYGTRLTDADVAKLQAAVPGVEIDYRRGGFLGVIGAVTQQAAVIGMVQPNSAAEQAGLKKDDVIRTFNGKAVANFAELTKEIAKHVAGDEVTLEIVRNGETMEVKVKLGQWQAP